MSTHDSDTTDLLSAATETPAMLLVDQRCRWLQGERVLVEEYCQQSPSLRNDAESLLDLIYSEVLLRERYGEQPQLTEYVERFPDLADQLRIQFELDQVVHPPDMISEGSGSVIGRYTLLEQIGAGGMGVVFVAQQIHPVARKVALKIIKPGMDTAEVIARFEAERQALALMDHSNIARVFDAGATASGRPYFVMELVQGTPITEYCDQHHLTIDDRLDLFVEVCHAVQHAHQKGIIHRDLKPSNVLVTKDDDRCVPKIIDFGLAKATGQQLTEKTLLTAYPQVMGTPIYMSPEQAALTNLDIDTRADIYALGVLLYELLTGTTPFEPARFRAAGFDEVRRMIREEEPPRPSTRINKLGKDGAATAACRGTELRRLQQLVECDLDWIVMRCLEKDRKRRYGTASALAMDVERYLNDQPVEACPPTRTYRLKKYIRRNKGVVLAGSTILALLVSAIVILAISNARIRRQIEAKEISLATTREAVQQMARLAQTWDERLSDIPGGELVYKALREDTLKFLEPIVRQAATEEESNYEAFVILESIADIEKDLRRYEDARRSCQRAINIVQRRVDDDPDSPVFVADLMRARACMVRIMFDQLIAENQAGEYEAELVPYCNELMDLKREYNRRHPDNLQPAAHELFVLGKIALERHGDTVAAERLLRESVWRSREYLHQNQSNTFEWINASRNAIWLGRLLQNNGAAGPENALPIFDQAHKWAQIVLKESPAMWTRGTAAIAELELAICHFQVQPSEHAISQVQRAVANLCHLSVSYPQPNIVLLYQARRAQATLIRQLQRLERTAEAAEAARHMADWLGKIAPQPSDDASLHRGLQLAQTENIGLLCATGQHAEAVQTCRQQISLWAELQRDATSDNFKPYLAGRYLTLTRLLTELGENDEANQAAAQADEMGLTDPSTLNELARNVVTALFAEPPPMAWQIGPAAAALAVEAAQQAANASPQDGRYLSTLGAAQYCAGEWQTAIKSFETSMELRGGGDAFDWFFLAMAHWQLDQRTESHTWFDKAVQWMHVNEPENDELRRFRVGANVLMGISAVTSITESVE